MGGTSRVAVIGAGIVGASVAYSLSKRGAEVVLLDASEPASGTTSASFAWVNANNKTPKPYFDLNLAGTEEHRRLSGELGGGWLHETGNIILAPESESGHRTLAERVERLRSWGYAAEMKTAAEASAELEPETVFPNPDDPVAHFPEETWADAPTLARILVKSARENGADARFGIAVKGIEPEDGKLAVRLEGGETIETEAVVNAAGPDAASVAAMVGRRLPLDVFRGLLVRVSSPENPIRCLIHTPTVNLRPDGEGFILLHHDSVDERLTDDFSGIEDPLCAELLERARRLVPAFENSSVVEARFGWRPVPGDGYSCVGAVPNVPGYFEAVTHSGVTLGPLIGRLLADEILDGKVDSLLAPYRPGRF
ncbi:MAG: FAD-binding oxidoreductase [Rubrobacter sp.]|nr:FAD-binding oxidoreductase [Rubrobacter sp.]